MNNNLLTWKYWWKEWIKPIIIAAMLAMVIRTFIAQPFRIPTNSMYPTLKPGDKMFVSKFIYGAKIPLIDFRLPALRQPELGDIVVFLSPIEKKKFLVKRYVAGGGQSIEIKDGKINIDGEPVISSPFNKIFYFNRGKFGKEGQVYVVPEGYFFALGDNSANSMDSRYWGVVPDKNLVGKAIFIHWPPRRIRLIKEKQ